MKSKSSKAKSSAPNFVAKVKVVKPSAPSGNSYQFECELDGEFLNNLSVKVGVCEESKVTDITDDLKLESFFLQQALASVVAGRGRLESCGRIFNRPPTYHAHLLKTVSHLQRIQKSEEAEKKQRAASMDAKRQRLLKASAKKIQHDTLQERQKGRTEDRKKLEAIKNKSKNGDAGDDFNVETVVEDIISNKKAKGSKPIGGENKKKFTSPASNSKRQSKDKKFGFGGKDRKMEKRNTRESVNDTRGFAKANTKSSFDGAGRGAGVNKSRGSSRGGFRGGSSRGGARGGKRGGRK